MEKKWRTRDGSQLDVTCMACDHLRHSIALILRKGWRLAWLDRLSDEYARRCNPPTVDLEKFGKELTEGR